MALQLNLLFFFLQVSESWGKMEETARLTTAICSITRVQSQRLSLRPNLEAPPKQIPNWFCKGKKNAFTLYSTKTGAFVCLHACVLCSWLERAEGLLGVARGRLWAGSTSTIPGSAPCPRLAHGEPFSTASLGALWSFCFSSSFKQIQFPTVASPWLRGGKRVNPILLSCPLSN